jgi:hypothetical protein
MPSQQLFINCYGIDRILGSIWVGCFIPKQPLSLNEPVTEDNLESRFKFMFKQITPESLSRSIPAQVLISKAVKYLISTMQIRNIESELKIHNCSSYALGKLGHPLDQVKPSAKISKLTLEGCKIVWAREMQKLEVYYPGISLIKLSATNHKAVGMIILDRGPTFSIRKVYLRRIPIVWLDLLRLGDISCNLDYFVNPPRWWTEVFGVPWYHFLEGSDINEAIYLISLQQTNFVTPTDVLKITRAKASGLTLAPNHDILIT